MAGYSGGRFDLHAQVVTMSRFRAAPRQGCMDRLKRIYSYAIGPRIMQLGLKLNNLITPSYQIKILTGHTGVMSMKSFLIACQELLGKAVVTTTTMDSN